MESSSDFQPVKPLNTKQNHIHYRECPLCRSSDIAYSLTAKDYTVSKENFEIWECNQCTARFTQDIPDAEYIGPYYQSSAYVSHSDTQEGVINKLYHIVRNFTLQSKRKLVEKYTGVSNGNLLDVGAGTGAFAAAMQQKGWNITGLEPDATARENALEKHQLTLIDPQELYSLPPSHFDAITMWHVLEHVHNLHGYLETYHRILKPGGTLVIAVPNYTSLDASKYKETWAAYDVSPKSLRLLASQKGFTVKAYQPMWFDSFYVAMLSEQYLTGKNNLIKAVWNGLLSNLNCIPDAKNCSSVIYIIQKN